MIKRSRLLVYCFVLSMLGLVVQAQQTPINVQEQATLLAELQPPKRERPVVAVIGLNEGTETTDYLIPYGVLKRADVAEVYALGIRPGPITLMPALTIVPDSSTADFDSQYPDGADYIIVPAMHHDDDPSTLRWIQGQASKGAIVIGICSGAKVLGNAGLLEGRKATTHWFDVSNVAKSHPTMQYVADRRFLIDRGVATTTGVTASIPMSLTLVEAIAGYERAWEVAQELGVDSWDARHDSAAFNSTFGFYSAAILNTLLFWNHETLGLNVETGIDEIALALTADAWSRTYRSKVKSISTEEGNVRTKNGISIVPDLISQQSKLDTVLPAISNRHSATALDVALQGIHDRYGQKTMSFVALQLEYQP